MKIVMLCDFYNESLYYQENLLSKYYYKNGHQVTVIASTITNVFDYVNNKYDKNGKAKEYFINDIKIIRQPYSLNILNKLRKLKNVAKILQFEKPDLIFAHDIHLNISDAVLYKIKNPNCRIIMDYHSDYSNSAKNWISLNILHKIIRKKFLNKVKKYIDKIFFVVPASRVFLNEVYGIPYNEMELLILGSDTDLAKEYQLKNDGLSIRNKLNIREDDFVIFTGGKLTSLKKTEILIKAFQNLNNINLHLLIVGDVDKLEIEYKEYLLNLSNGNDRIHFAGWLSGSEVYRYMNTCDLAIFPQSQSVLWQQAICMGLPLIVGDLGGQSLSYLNKYENIIILNSNQITSEIIENHILNLINNKSLLEKMRLGAIKATEEFLNYDNIIKKTLYQ